MARILGVDLGGKRVGFAVSDPTGVIATPLCVVQVKDDADRVRVVMEQCRETGAERLVVGLPVNMNGTHGPAVEAVVRFVERVRALLDVPVDTWDERLTTKMAERVLIEAGMSRRGRKKVVDKLAAQLILQGYLDAKSCPLRTSPG